MRGAWPVRWGLVLLAVLTGCRWSAAAGLRDLGDGWLLGPGGQAAFLGADERRDPGAWALVGQSRLYGLAALPVLGLSAGARLGRGRVLPVVALGWETTGRGPYREDVRRLEVVWGGSRSLGLAWEGRRITTGGEGGFPTEAVSAQRLAGSWQAGWQVGTTVVRGRLLLPLVTTRDPLLAPGRTALLDLQGWRGPLAVAVAVTRGRDGAPGLAIEWQLGAGGGACGLRLDPATGAVGLVLAWRRGALLVRTSHLVHPDLGLTHRLQLGGGGWGAVPW